MNESFEIVIDSNRSLFSSQSSSNLHGSDPLFVASVESVPTTIPVVETEPEPPIEDLTEDEPAHDFMDIKIEQPNTPEAPEEYNNEYDSDHNPGPKSKKRRRREKSVQPAADVELVTEGDEEAEDNQSVLSEEKNSANGSVVLSKQEQEEWSDVVKMSDYLTNGRRPQFWEEPFTRRVLEAIKNKDLEMKKAAVVLGVSYGTLYGRYRDVYGCLKHPQR